MHDVLVIGGGPGGYAAAIRAAQLGADTALVENAELGGTCVNRGCIPSKIWMRAVHLKLMLDRAAEFGLKTEFTGWELPALVERTLAVAGGIREGMRALIQKNGVTLYQGRGALKNPREVNVDGQTVAAKNIIIATGSTLAAPGVPAEKLLTTDQLFAEGNIPASVTVAGDGPIELEMAAILQMMGAETTLALPGRRALPDEDQDLAQRVTAALREQGVTIAPNTALADIDAEVIAFGGRAPNTENLGLTAAGVSTNDDGAIPVNENTRTNQSGVYAVGDVTGGWMLSHAASTMGVAAAENACGQKSVYNDRLVPRGLWTTPQAASVGLTEEEAEKLGFDVEVGDFPYPVNGMAMLRGEVDGSVKIVSDGELGEILGVHIVGAHATELIGEAVLALQLECTVDDLAHTIRMHPTFSEGVMDSARDADGWALYLPPR